MCYAGKDQKAENAVHRLQTPNRTAEHITSSSEMDKFIRWDHMDLCFILWHKGNLVLV